MKYHVLYFAVLMAIIASACDSQKKESPGTHDSESKPETSDKSKIEFPDCLMITDAGKEYPLDFGNPTNDKNVYSYAKYELEPNEEQFYAHYRYGNDEQLDNTFTKVKVSYLCSFYNIIKSNSNYHPENGDLSALRMYFGMQDKRIVIIYEPVILKETVRNQRYESKLFGRFWTADASGSLSEINNAAVLIQNYQSQNSNIYIKHITGAGTKFIDKDDDFSVGDVKYCTMPLQQIFRMYRDNSNGYNPDDAILFTIVASDYFSNSGDNYKTHIVANYKTGSIPEQSNTYKGLGADFSQMSPPNNNTVEMPPTYNEEKGKEAEALKKAENQ